MTKKIKSLGLDLGNGFIKMYDNGSTLIEQAVFSLVPKTDFMTDKKDSYEVNNHSIYIGKMALSSGLPLKSALGNTDALSRYSSADYTSLLYAFISKFYCNEDVEIDCLVLGLPNNHFASCRDIVKTTFENKKQLVSNKLVSIKEVIVLPQPYGGYIAEAITNKNIMIIDLGHGTCDYTHIGPNGALVSMFATDEGVKKYYLSILSHLQRKYPSHGLKLEDVPLILDNGLTSHRGLKIDFNDTFVDETRLEFANELLKPIIDRYDYLHQFDNIIFIGGGSSVYQEAIVEMQTELPNIYIANDSQLVNAKGFYMFGKAHTDSIVSE